MLIARLVLPYVLDHDAAVVGSRQTCDPDALGAVVEGASEDRGAVGQRPCRLVDRDVVVAEDRDAPVRRDRCTVRQLHHLRDGGTAEGAHQVEEAAPGARVHGEVVDLTVLVRHQVDEVVEQGEAERPVLCDDLGGVHEGEQPGELVVDTGAIDQHVLELATGRLRLACYL